MDTDAAADRRDPHAERDAVLERDGFRFYDFTADDHALADRIANALPYRYQDPDSSIGYGIGVRYCKRHGAFFTYAREFPLQRPTG